MFNSICLFLYFSIPSLLDGLSMFLYTMFPISLYPFYIISSYITWVKTSETYTTNRSPRSLDCILFSKLLHKRGQDFLDIHYSTIIHTYASQMNIGYYSYDDLNFFFKFQVGNLFFPDKQRQCVWQ